MPRVAQRDIDDRRRAMTALLRERSYLPVGELCRKFGISEATARRDLVALTEQKAIVRTFGGAMADYDRRFTPFADRLKVSPRAKAKIAVAAASLIKPGMTVFLDAGTTVSTVAERLRRRPMDVHVVTNSLAVADRLAGIKGIDVDLLGGHLLPIQSVLLGELACRAAAFYQFDVALLGAEGFDAEGIWNSTEDVVALQQAVVRQSDRHAVCIDGGKSGVRAPALLLAWDQLDLIVTDAAKVPVGPMHTMRA